MRTPILIAAASLLVGCTTMIGPDGKEHRVMDITVVNESVAAASTVADAIFPGAGKVIQGIGYLLGVIGLADRKKKGIPAP